MCVCVCGERERERERERKRERKRVGGGVDYETGRFRRLLRSMSRNVE